ncbi:starch-binding domain-containing protein 1 [Anomaloglossus baeobatrachus]|uniref:starch-binding domain-containing protein 1 n=1 Tax=Anomaloglossus baeobatrachus TaxID=238106 RepID=UPI003F506D78
MWTVLAIGIFTAIIAWIWFRGNGERTELEAPGQKPDPAGTAETDPQNVQPRALDTPVTAGESTLITPDPAACERGVPCHTSQESAAVSPGTPQVQCEIKELSVDTLEGGLQVQNDKIAKTNAPLHVQEADNAAEELSGVPRKVKIQGDLQEHRNDEVLPGNIKEYPTDLKEDTRGHLTAVTKEKLHDIVQEPPTTTEEHHDIVQEPPTKPDEVHDIVQEPPTKTEEHHDIVQEPPTKPDEVHDIVQEPPTKPDEVHDIVQEPPTKPDEVHDIVQEPPTKTEEHHDIVQEPPAKTDEVHGIVQEPPTKTELHDIVQEPPTKTEEVHGVVQESPTKTEELHGIVQEPPTKRDQAVNITESVSGNEENRLLHDGSEAEPHPENSPGIDPQHPEDYNPGRTLNEDQGNVVQACGEVVHPTILAPEAQKVLAASCDAGMSDQDNGLGTDTVHQDGAHNKGRTSGADEEAENGTGGQLENSFFVKENTRNVLEYEGTLKQDPFLEINVSSDIECAIVADQLIKDENIEQYDIDRMSKCTVDAPTRLKENADILPGSLNKCNLEALCEIQKLGSCLEDSSMEIYSMINDEKGISGFSSSDTNEQNSVYGLSEAYIHEADQQKTKKVATIQPMPQNVNFGFKVHYITHSDSQIIAVTGDHEKLGKWETYVPLTSGNGGFWSHSMSLPADTNVAWKFIMVENGKIRRWEECNNRLLKITHEDIDGQLFWGYP